MRFLRRNTTTESTEAADADAVAEETVVPKGHTPGKGRPTPKRREAEGKRRGPVPPPPRTTREALRRARGNKEERKALAAKRREVRLANRQRMMSGDEKYLPARDRGPVKAYVRDLVDSRPHIMGLFMPLALVVVLSLLVPIPAAQQYLSLFSLVALSVMIVEGIFLGVTITRKTREKFPDENVGALGTGWYAFTRATQLRRMRVPKPRVQRGANP